MGYRLSKIYTRTGDEGTTSLDGKHRVPKNSLSIEAVGTLDELNCTIGLVLTQPDIPHEIYECLAQIQNELFDLGGELCPPHRLVISANHIDHLEKTLDKWNATLPPLKEFLLPRGNFASVMCQLARTVCRRAERCIVALNSEEKLNPEILRYINRLSDLLFVTARVLALENHVSEETWAHTKNKRHK